MLKFDKQTLAGRLEQIILRPDATRTDIEKVCNDAILYGFHAVCVNTANVKMVSNILKNSNVRVCAASGFPLGANISEVKALEARKAVENGAYYIDAVINVAKAKQSEWNFIEEEISLIREATGKHAELKVILEACLLTDEEKAKVCECAKRAGADYVKTSTGYSTGGATLHDVALMHSSVGHNMKVKAAGGIKDARFAVALLNAGAYLLGTSKGPEIIDSYDYFINN